MYVFSQIKDRKHFELNFNYVAWIMPGVGLWVLGGQNFSLWICDGALSTVRSSCFGKGGVVVCVCFIMYYLVCLHLYEEDRVGCYVFIVFLVHCDC